jgi:S-adenosylmethionine hydrolase
MGQPTKVDWITPPFVEARSPETAPYVVHIDRFGNIVTNIRHDVPGVDMRRLKLKIGRRLVRSWVDTYKAIKPGEICLIPGSTGLVEIVMKERSAAAYLRVKLTSRLEIQ